MEQKSKEWYTSSGNGSAVPVWSSRKNKHGDIIGAKKTSDTYNLYKTIQDNYKLVQVPDLNSVVYELNTKIENGGEYDSDLNISNMDFKFNVATDIIKQYNKLKDQNVKNVDKNTGGVVNSAAVVEKEGDKNESTAK